MSAQDVLPRLLPLRDWSHTLALCALLLAAEALFFLGWGLVRTRSRRFAWITGALAGLCAVGSWVLARQALTTYQQLYGQFPYGSYPPGYVDPYPQLIANALTLYGTAHWVAIGVVVAFGLVALGLLLRAALTWIRQRPQARVSLAS